MSPHYYRYYIYLLNIILIKMSINRKKNLKLSYLITEYGYGTPYKGCYHKKVVS